MEMYGIKFVYNPTNYNPIHFYDDEGEEIDEEGEAWIKVNKDTGEHFVFLEDENQWYCVDKYVEEASGYNYNNEDFAMLTAEGKKTPYPEKASAIYFWNKHDKTDFLNYYNETKFKGINASDCYTRYYYADELQKWVPVDYADAIISNSLFDKLEEDEEEEQEGDGDMLFDAMRDAELERANE